MSTEQITTPPAPVVDPDEPVPVDQIPTQRKTAFDRITAHREGSKQPVVVPWLKDPDEREPILRWAAGYALHVVRFHLVRLPIYQWRLTRRAPVGLWRVLAGLFNALTDSEGRPLRQSAVARDNVTEYMQLTRERNARIRHQVRPRIRAPAHPSPPKAGAGPSTGAAPRVPAGRLRTAISTATVGKSPHRAPPDPTWQDRPNALGWEPSAPQGGRMADHD